jgi:hypothetical protein
VTPFPNNRYKRMHLMHIFKPAALATARGL